MSSKNIDEMMSVGSGAVAGMPTASPAEQTPIRKKKTFKILRRKTLAEAKKVTTKASGHGFHDVFVDGEKHPSVQIVNGSGGVSGYGRNVYGVHYSKLNRTRWVGSLQKTKRHIETVLSKNENT